eukprot:48676-Rhodomonas_salina.1
MVFVRLDEILVLFFPAVVVLDAKLVELLEFLLDDGPPTSSVLVVLDARVWQEEGIVVLLLEVMTIPRVAE